MDPDPDSNPDKHLVFRLDPDWDQHNSACRPMRIGRPLSASVFRRCSMPLRRPPCRSPPMGCSTSSLQLASCAPPSSPAWTPQAVGSQGKVSGNAGRRHHSPLQQPVEQPPTHGEEEGRLMAPLRRVPPPQPTDCRG
jgi:hypothetical protein